MKLSLHTAQASLRPASSDATRCARENDASLRLILILSGNLAIWAYGRLYCAPLGDSSGTHQATGVAHHLLFPVDGGSTCSLAIRHLADVGISGPLQTGLGFFGLLNAALSALPCGWGDHDPRGPSAQPFHVLHPIQEDLGPLCYTGSLVSSRRATLDNPVSTACQFWLKP
jgi:hypothetical protein